MDQISGIILESISAVGKSLILKCLFDNEFVISSFYLLMYIS